MNPQIGDIRITDCTWCRRPNVRQVYRAYGNGLSGGYWDASECICATIVQGDGVPMLQGLARYGQKVVESLKRKTPDEDG